MIQDSRGSEAEHILGLWLKMPPPEEDFYDDDIDGEDPNYSAYMYAMDDAAYNRPELFMEIVHIILDMDISYDNLSKFSMGPFSSFMNKHGLRLKNELLKLYRNNELFRIMFDSSVFDEIKNKILH